MQKIVKISGKSFIEIFIINDSILYANWCGYLNVDQVKEGCQAMLDAVVKYKLHLILNDNRLLLGSFTQAINWLKNEYMSNLVRAGTTRIAFIYSRDDAAKYSINRLLEVNTEYEGQAFDEYQEAFNWLTGITEINFTNIFLKVPNKLGEDISVIIKDILYISSLDNQITIFTKDSEYTCKKSLKSILEELPQPQFYRVHRSFIVNIHNVTSMKYHAGGAYRLYIAGLGEEFIPVGRSYAISLKETLRNLLE
ncbi:LytR/AlgR family response regulator transcription factor [Portibacter lacus]|uniref:HTH LytTR-type domain-containing protein n=1 Tax=Portibacter lacus TaxID=1099794 RepID=A0AA37WFX3_9BACT|nr:LytTR family DNA-binding domain-containing protein [Portibacter lacus]GLR17385.1 hypothetical protein GCM10007940_20000 [Portibacter lacus]